MELYGKHALITGAAKRVGRALAEAFLARGANLSAHTFQSDVPDSLKAHAKKNGRSLLSVRADLRSTEEIARAVQTAVDKLGPVDILVNSASVFTATDALTSSESEWDDVLDINLRGQFFFARECARAMLAGGSSEARAILNIADVYGERPLPRFSAYTAAKAGVLMLTKNLAREWAPRVRVNAISPGAVLLPEHYTEEQKARSIRRTPLSRLGSPEDIVSAAILLIENDYLTGVNLHVDGGRSIA